MKKLLLLIVLIISLKSFSQTPSNFVYRNIYEHTKGSYPDSVLHLPVGCGAPALLTTRSWKGGAALYGDTCNNKLYFYRDTAWTLIGDSSYNDIRYLANTISCGLTCSACGIVTYTGTGMNYYVSPAYYNIDFVPYYFTGDSITLADGDATFDRFDAIVLTATGVDTIQGVPSSDPQLPQFDGCANILLTYVLVTAGTTVPAQVSDEVIYDENVETWTHTTGGTISANFAGTAQVFHGTKSITISSWSNNSYINFLGPSSYVNSNYTTLSFWVRLTAIMVNNQNVSVQFFNNTTAVSNPVVGQITKGNITTYQSVGFNMSQFTFTSPVFNTVRIQFSGNQANTFYLDWVRLQAGITQPPPSTGITTRDRFGYPNEDVTMGENRSVNFRGTRTMNFDSVNAFGVYRNGINRMYVNNLSSGIFSPNGLNSAQTSDVVSQLNANNRTFVYTYNDSIALLNPDGSYSIYALPHIIDTSANKIMTWNASTKKISWGNWFGGISGITGDNGLTANTATNVRLGGTLTQATTITGGTNLITFTGSNTGTNYTTTITNSSTGRALSVTSSSGIGINSNASSSGTAINGVSNTGTGIFGTSTSNVGVFGTTASTNATFDFAAIYGRATGNTPGLSGRAVTGQGVYATSDSSYGVYANRNSGISNVVKPVLAIVRSMAGGNTASDGIGGSIEFYNETDATNSVLSNTIESKLTTAANATATSQLFIKGLNGGATNNSIISFEGNGRTKLYGRLEMQQGADVASVAGAIALGLDGNTFEITGTNAITLISNLGWQNGAKITLLFTSTATLTDGTANSGTDIGMELPGNANFVATADDVVTLVLSEIGGVQRWRAVSVSVN